MTVIMDRYAYSGVAYSSAKGLNLNWCKNSDIGLPRPDVVFFLKMDETAGMNRKDYGDEIYERSAFQQKVKIQYDLLQENFWTIINATDTIENVHAAILDQLKQQMFKVKAPLNKLWLELEI